MLLTILLESNPGKPEAWQALQKVLSKVGMRLVIDLLTVFALIRLVYYPVYKKKELFFTYTSFNLVIFLICFLLNKVDLSMGAAFGLFAVFSMLRYKTEDIDLKDMTYLFLVISIGLMTAVAKLKDVDNQMEYVFLAMINGFLVLIAFVLENKWISRLEQVKMIYYDRIELVNVENRQQLIEDIKIRTGINVHRVEIQKIDFLRDSANVKIFYYE